jgi:hypothetical protein
MVGWLVGSVGWVVEDWELLLRRTCSSVGTRTRLQNDGRGRPSYQPLTTHHSPLTTHHSPLTPPYNVGQHRTHGDQHANATGDDQRHGLRRRLYGADVWNDSAQEWRGDRIGRRHQRVEGKCRAVRRDARRKAGVHVARRDGSRAAARDRQRGLRQLRPRGIHDRGGPGGREGDRAGEAAGRLAGISVNPSTGG